MHTIGSHFNAHDAYADVKAFSDVLNSSSYSEKLIVQAKTSSKQLQTSQQQEKDDSAKVEIRNELFIFLRSDLIATKLSTRGITCNLLKEKLGEKCAYPFSAQMTVAVNFQEFQKMRKN